MQSKALKTDIVRWAKKIGRKEAARRLIILGLSPTMAERLAKGNYESEPHPDTAEKIRAEISRDGFPPAGEKAS